MRLPVQATLPLLCVIANVWDIGKTWSARQSLKSPSVTYLRDRHLNYARSRARAFRMVLPPGVNSEGIESSKRSYFRSVWFRDWDGFISEVTETPPDCVVVLCGGLAGNVGAALRTCALFGIPFIVVVGGFSNRDKDRALHSSQLLRRPEWNVSAVTPPASMSATDVLKQLQVAGMRSLGLTAHAGGETVPIWTRDLVAPRLALVFGRERDGIPRDAEKLLDMTATIPMNLPGEEGSFNVGLAVAIVAYERQKQVLSAYEPTAGTPQPAT